MIKYLTTFVAVAKHLSFAKAADHIGISHTGASMHIKRLEDDLECHLFDRSGKRRIALSPHGHALLPLARDIVEQYQRLRLAAAGEEILSGKLRLGIISSVQNYLFPISAKRFYRTYPKAEIVSVPGASVHLSAKVDSGEIDMAVIDKSAFNFPKSLSWTPILSEPYVVVAPENAQEKTVHEVLAKYGLIAYPSYSNSGKKVSHFLDKQRIVAKKIMEEDDPFIILRLVEQGLGAAITPWYLTCAIAEFAQKTKVIPLGKLTFYREVGILQKEENVHNPLATELIKAFVESAATLAKAARKSGR